MNKLFCLFVILLLSMAVLHAYIPDLFMTNGTHILFLNKTNKTVLDLQKVVDITKLKKSQFTSGSTDSYSGYIHGLTADISMDLMFWSVNGDDFCRIYRSSLNGSDIQEIISGYLFHKGGHMSNIRDSVNTQELQIKLAAGCEEVLSLSVDWVSQHIYWADTTLMTVEMSHYDGSGRRLTVMFDVSKPCYLVVDPIFGFVFWMDCGRQRLERMRLDGSDRIVIVASGIIYPTQISISYATRRIYWLESENRHLISSDMHGNDVTIERDLSTYASTIYGLIIINSHVYISANGSSILAARIGGNHNTRVDELVYNPGDGRLYTLVSGDTDLQPQSYHPCMDITKGGCSDICLPTEGIEYMCVCATYGGLTIAADSLTCTAPQSFLIYTLQDDGLVELMSVDPGAPHYDRTLIGSSPHPAAVAFDPHNQVVYWSDLSEKRIYRASLNASYQEIFMDTDDCIASVYALAFDWLNGRLYFTNMDEIITTKHTRNKYISHSIEMISEDKSYHKTITTDVVHPRGLSLDLTNRYMYIADWGEPASIKQAWLDGSNMRTLIAIGMHRPSGVTVAGNLVYVVQSSQADQKIANALVYNIAIDTWTPVHLGGQVKTSLMSVAANGSTLYYTEWNNDRRVTEAHIASYVPPSDHKVLLKGGRPMSILYHDTMTLENIYNACTQSLCHRGQCVNTNIMHTPGYRCICPDGTLDFIYSTNSTSCQVAENFAIFADLTTIKLVNLDLHAGEDSVKTLVHGRPGSNFIALTYHSPSNTIYWSDETSHSILSLRLTDNTHIVTTVLTTNYSIHGITVESSGRLFWTASNDSMQLIVRYTPHRGMRSYKVIITDLDAPRAIISHYPKRLIFWTEYGISSGIACVKQSKVSGHHTVTLMHKDLHWPNSLAITDLTLYVADGYYRRVFSMNLNGSMKRELVFLSGAMDHIYGLAIHEHVLFFTDWYSNSTYMVDTVTGHLEMLADHLYRPTAIIVHHPHKLSDSAYCADSGCDDRCIPVPRGHHCTCDVGRQLQRDGKHCHNVDHVWEVREPYRCGVTCSQFAQCARLIPTVHHQCVCNQGYEGDGIICTSCKVNTYKSVVTNKSCTACPKHMGTRGNKASTLCVCNVKQAVQRNGSCIVLPAVPKTEIIEPTKDKVDASTSRHRLTSSSSQGITASGLHNEKYFSSTRFPTPYPPQFENCPDGETIILVLPPSSKQALLPVTWKAKDSQGKPLSISSNYELEGNYVPLDWLASPDQRHVLTFTARDHRAHVAHCQFSVIVKDLEAPKFIYCPHDITTSTSQLRERVLWPKPTATDNIRVQHIVGSAEPGDIFPLGVKLVNYTATDQSGNMATCNFTIIVRENLQCNLPAVVHGSIQCGDPPYQTHVCFLKCDSGFSPNPIVSLTEKFNCLAKHDASHVYATLARHQPCFKQQKAVSVTKQFSMSFEGRCSHDNSALLAQVSKSVIHFIRHTRHCQNPTCIITNATLICGSSLSRPLPTVNKRSKRAAIQSFMFIVIFNVSLGLSSGMTIDQAKLAFLGIEHELMTLTTHWSLLYNGQTYRGIPNSVRTRNSYLGCQLGYILINQHCIECPRGSWHDIMSATCKFCPWGTYQPRGGGTSCISCDGGANTTDAGSSTPQHCVEPSGTDDMTKFIIIACATACLILLALTVLICCQMQRNRATPRRSLSTTDEGNTKVCATSARNCLSELNDDRRYSNSTHMSLIKDGNGLVFNTNKDVDEHLNNRPSHYINWRDFNERNPNTSDGLPDSSNHEDAIEHSAILCLPFSNNHQTIPSKPNKLSPSLPYDSSNYSNTLSLPFSNHDKIMTSTVSKRDNHGSNRVSSSFDGLYRPLHKPVIAVSSFNIKHGSNATSHGEGHVNQWSPTSDKFSPLHLHTCDNDASRSDKTES